MAEMDGEYTEKFVPQRMYTKKELDDALTKERARIIRGYCEETFEDWWKKNWSDDCDDDMTPKDYARAGWHAAQRVAKKYPRNKLARYEKALQKINDGDIDPVKTACDALMSLPTLRKVEDDQDDYYTEPPDGSHGCRVFLAVDFARPLSGVGAG